MFKEIKKKIENIKVNKRNGEFAVYKPLLLLIILEQLRAKRNNEFRFDEVSDRLIYVIQKNGWGKISKKRAAYPFFFLASSDLWNTSIDRRKLENPSTLSGADLEGVVGWLEEGIYSFLVANPESIQDLVNFIQNKFFIKSPQL